MLTFSEEWTIAKKGALVNERAGGGREGARASRAVNRAIARAARSRLIWAGIGAATIVLGAGALAVGTRKGRSLVAPLVVQALLSPIPPGVPRRATAVGSAVHSGVPAETALSFLSPEWDASESRRVEVRSADGRFRLAGWERAAPEPTNRWVVLVHGWRGFHGEVDMLAAIWGVLGWNVLAVDLRAHGSSEGDWAGMGGPDAADLAVWAGDIVRRYGEDARIVLHGHSMGGATVLGASAEGVLPRQVEAVVADCSFTSAGAMFDDLARSVVPLRSARTLLFEEAREWLLEQGGYDLSLSAPIERVRASRVPVLFFHGTADNFVPPWMTGALFDACAAPLKWLHFVPRAGHCESARRDPARYFGTVLAFLDAVASGASGSRIV